MAVVAADEAGWVLDHKASLDSTYSWCHQVGNGDTKKTAIFQCKRALFAIQEPFTMDSQFNKSLMSGACRKQDTVDSQQNTRTKKKRKRQREMNAGEKSAELYHRKVRDLLLKAYHQLLSLARKKGYFQDDCPSIRDNNTAAREAAMSGGPGDKLVHLSNMAKESLAHHCPLVTVVSENTEECPDLFNTLVCCESENACVRHWLGDQYLIPPRCRFLMSDITCMEPLCRGEQKYDCIVIDPPWENKSVKRKKNYGLLTDYDLYKLPVSELAADGALVLIWLTNKQQQHNFVKHKLFPHWSIQLVAEWYWLKLTQRGQMVSDLDSAQKRPYEVLLIGRFRPNNKETVQLIGESHSSDTSQMIGQTHDRNVSYDHTRDKSKVEVCEARVEDTIAICIDPTSDASQYRQLAQHLPAVSDTNKVVFIDDKVQDSGKLLYGGEAANIDQIVPNEEVTFSVPDHKVMLSVPCSIHSHKPPLHEILKPYLKNSPRCLELFARNLISGWTSWGNEVLKYQHIDYFEKA